MSYFIFEYKGGSRELKRAITAILKSGLSDNIKKFNYVHNYCINDKNVEKTEEKLLLIYTEDYDKLMNFLSKNFPQIQEIKIS